MVNILEYLLYGFAAISVVAGVASIATQIQILIMINRSDDGSK